MVIYLFDFIFIYRIFFFSSEGYRAFLGAHTSMNKIQLYMQQIPVHIKTIIKVLSSNASPKLISRVLPVTINNIERVGRTCITLARSTEDSFLSVMNLLDEVIEVTKVTQGLHEKELHDKEIELNVTRVLHADMKREEEIRRQHYEEIRQAVRKAQEEYSRALKDIPTGFKALALDLGRAAISLLKSFTQVYLTKNLGGGRFLANNQQITDGKQSFARDQTLNFASRFSQSLDSLIERLSSNEKDPIDNDELNGYKVIFGTFANMINNIPNNKAKKKASDLIQRAIQLVNTAINDENATITDELENLSDEIKPYTAAEQISNANDAPISVSSESDSSKNELFKAQLAQVRLGQIEQRLDQQFSSHMAAMEQMRILSGKLANLDLTIIHFKEILEMLKEAFILLGRLRQHWHQLVEFFTNFSAQIVAGFDEKLKTFLDTTRFTLDAEISDVDRIIVLELLNGNSINLHHESYTLYTMSRTYFDVSKKYLMPRLAGLQLMLAATNNDQRQNLLQQLERDTTEVQTNVTELINRRKQIYQKAINEKRAEFNELIDNQDVVGDEYEIIKQGKNLLE